MTVPMRKPRGRPFLRGNPGRPLGSRNRVTQTLEQLAEGQAEQIFQKVLEGSPGRRRVLPEAAARPHVAATESAAG
jgi:hypothetical protein